MSTITYDVVKIAEGQDHACSTFEDEELNEAMLSNEPETRKRELELLDKMIAGFDGDYDEACGLFSEWIDKIEEGL